MKKYSDFYEASNVLKVLCRDSAEDVTIVGIPTWISEPYFNADCVPGRRDCYVVDKESQLDEWRTLAEKLKNYVTLCTEGIEKGFIKEKEIEQYLFINEEDFLKDLFEPVAKCGKLTVPYSEVMDNLVTPVFWTIYDNDITALPWTPSEAEMKAVYRCATGKTIGSGKIDANIAYLLKNNLIQKITGYGVPITYIIYWDEGDDFHGKAYRVYSDGKIRNCYDIVSAIPEDEVRKLDIMEAIEYGIGCQVCVGLDKDAETSLKYLRERKKNKLTVKKLAELSGVSQRTIEDYEQKRRPIWKARVDIIMRLAKVMQVEPIDILDFWEE